MKVRKYLPRGVVALAAVAALGAPSQGEAQSINANAYATAWCAGQCDVVRFMLTIPSTTAYIDLVRIFSRDASKWQFASLMGVQDMNGADLGWWSSLSNGGLLLRSSGNFAPDPIILTVQMSVWTNQLDLSDGSLSITGQGNTQSDGLGQDISFGATVTPEPASMLLLGTGLMGVVGAARRRRRTSDA